MKITKQELLNFVSKTFRLLPVKEKLDIAQNYAFYDFTEDCFDFLKLSYHRPENWLNRSDELEYIVTTDDKIIQLTTKNIDTMMTIAYKNLDF